MDNCYTTPRLFFVARQDGIVPFTVECVCLYLDMRKVFIGYFDSTGIRVLVDIRLDVKAAAGMDMSNQMT